MKIISFNVNGIRACKEKGFDEFLKRENADIVCLQETKIQKGQIDLNFESYELFLSCAEKKGYSGTLIYTKQKPLSARFGIDEKYNDEGRIITLEYEKFYLVNCYVPNSQQELKRLDYRMQFEDDLRNYLLMLSSKKSVIYCGDLNVAHEEIDIKNPKANERNAGYSIEERTKMTQLLDAGFIDTFRAMHKDEQKFSWWSYRFSAREKNIGWRLDYFIVSKDLRERVVDSNIKTEVLGSDHAPIVLEINL